MFRRSISARLIAAFIGMALLAALAVGITALVQLHQVNERLADVVESLLPSTRDMLDMDSAQNAILADERSLVTKRIFILKDRRQTLFVDLKAAWVRAEAAGEDYEKLPKDGVSASGESEEALWKRTKEVWKAWKDRHGTTMRLLDEKAKLLEASPTVESPEMPALDQRILASADEAMTSFTAVKALLRQLIDMNVAEASQGQVRAQAAQTLGVVIMIATMAAAVLAALGLGLLLTRRIARPLLALTRGAEAFATGDLTARIEHHGQDELGRLAEAFRTMAASLGRRMGELTAQASSLEMVSDRLGRSTARIGSAAQATSAQAGTVSAAAEQVSRNSQTVAIAAEEMTASIREIAKNAGDAATVGKEAAAESQIASTTVGKLDLSSQEIGKVIKVISSIAEQTNLLALNATIEAARAGEAGRGFAVVAGEVKELARQTALATAEIGPRITAIQQDSQAAVQAIGRITAIITRIDAIQQTIASAVEEQAATTNEMGRNIAEAASGAGSIASTITGVASAASDSAEATTEVMGAAEELARVVGQLRGIVAAFTC